MGQSSTRQLRIALVGLGDIAAKAYLPLMTQRADISPILCTRNEQILRQFAEQYRVSETYVDYAQLLNQPVDAVMIHSATSSHAALIEQALTRGIAVFVDKPISDRLDQTESLIDLALRKNTPLFCGFNRRYVPLYQPVLANRPLQIHYQKNRHNLPGDVRTFVYDDFIHVLDFVRFAMNELVSEPMVSAYFQDGALGSLQVNWQENGRAVCASMNRLSGQTCERLDISQLNEAWQLDNLTTGVHLRDNQRRVLPVDDWTSTLQKRGFVAMLEAFIASVRAGVAQQGYLEGVRATHRLCEQVVFKVNETA